jgi:hypothetical protein
MPDWLVELPKARIQTVRCQDCGTILFGNSPAVKPPTRKSKITIEALLTRARDLRPKRSSIWVPIMETTRHQALRMMV